MEEKDLSDIKEEVYKCSKCALCKSVCPVYNASKNEMYLPRGRFIILNNFFNNKKRLTKSFIKDLDKCLNCNQCKNFCPSNINSVKIFARIKEAYNYKYSLIRFSTAFKIRMYISFIKSLFYKRTQIKNTNSDKKDRIVYFEGCINKYVNPKDRNAVLNILKTMGYTNIEINRNCCGITYLSDGELKKYKKNAVKIIKSLPEGAKYILCSCDSCYETLKDVLEGSSLQAKLINFDEFLKLNNYPMPEPKEDEVYHKPLIRTQNTYLNERIKTLNNKTSFTLMENFIIWKNKAFAKLMEKESRYSESETNGKTIITTCQLSKLGLEMAGYKSEIVSYAEYLNKKIK